MIINCSTMNKVIRYGLIGLLVLGVFAAFVYVIKTNRADVQLYEFQKPQLRTIMQKTVATGKIVPRKEIDIKPNVSGIVSKVYVKEGQKVKKGDLIARIEVVEDMQNLNNADSRLRNAQITLQNSRRNYERQKKLFEQGVIAAADFEKVQTQYRTDRQNLVAAQRSLEIIKTGSAQGLSAVGNTLIRSTVEGTVLDVPIEVGSQVTMANNFNPGTTIATVADLGQMIFDGEVDEVDVDKVKEGTPVEISVGAIEDTTFKAELEFISPKGESQNGVIQFEIKAPVQLIKGIFLRSGYSANASVKLREAKDVISLPEALLQYDLEGEPYVEVQTAKGRYKKKKLTLGISDNHYVEIKSGIDTTARIKVWNPTTKKSVE